MIIWMIERPCKGLAGLSTSVIGNFPVRCFASCESFRYLTERMELSQEDLVLVVACSDFTTEELDSLNTYLASFASRIPIFWVSPEFTSLIKKNDSEYLVPLEDLDELNHLISRLEKVFSVSGTESEAHSIDRLSQIKFGDFVIDWQNSVVFSQHDIEVKIYLTAKELRLLCLFVENSDIYHTREAIMNKLWEGDIVSKRTVDSHVSRLRKRIAPLGFDIVNRYGLGYRVSWD